MPPRKKKQVNDNEQIMSLEEATEYLKKMEEWWVLRNESRETVIKWANHLYHHENNKNKTSKDIES